ncbi:carcinoembryonic antigen-related cell adhesion molecule 6-like [Gigantopelta aegis]|uniref:carcinoembryonic antigen-related cell adhesion molecule 6-like n=1 Tax=Gigantopelta aegis TaxID=1735272 RepID=UPI001B88D2C4|nr:carcinoembryonic antigen-related cell adhesion molecule 6-like [Gigantopelta aegis]
MRNMCLLWLHLLLLSSSNIGDAANTSIDCMTGGYPGQKTTLICNIIGSLTRGIYFKKSNGGSPQVVIMCYSAVILSSTQTTLTIESFNSATDAGEWTCYDGPSNDGRSTCNKTVLYGPVAGSIKFIRTAKLKEGQHLTVDCTVGCNPPCNYSWILGNEEITTRPLLNLTDINRNQDGNVYNRTVTNSAIQQSISKNFTLSVSYGPERMSALSAGAISGIVIAVVLALAVPTVWIVYKRKIKTKAEDVQNEQNN